MAELADAKSARVEYFVAVVMGYFVSTNALVERRARSDIGASYANPILGLMSAIGGFGGWFCVLPAAYFVATNHGNGFLHGMYFCAAALGGGLLAGLAQIPGINYLISSFTLPVNIGLAALVYFLART